MSARDSARVQALSARVCEAIETRIPCDEPLYIIMDDEPLAVRNTRVLGPDPRPSILRMAYQGLGSMFSFRLLLMRALGALPGVGDVEEWGRSAIWYLAAAGCGYARRLVEQLDDVSSVAIELARFPEDFTAAMAACIQEAERGQSLIAEFARGCANALKERKVPGGGGMVAIGGEPNARRVDWMPEDEALTAPALTESLEAFVDDLLARASAEAFLKTVEEQIASQKPAARRGKECLEAVCPSAAEAVNRALKETKGVAVRLAAGCTRKSIPMTVWLYVSPGSEDRRGAHVMLAAHRAHDGFVIEGPPARQELYYFPPSVLVAKLTVWRESLAVTDLPTVLVPKGAPFWVHPYSGMLGHGGYAAAALMDEDDPAYRPPPPEALRLFPGLNQRAKERRENDLCVAGQKQGIQTLEKRFRESERSGPPDVLSFVTGLHDIVRHALTRGHVKNDGPPRVSLLDCPWKLRKGGIPAALAGRIYSYDPEKPVVATPIPAPPAPA